MPETPPTPPPTASGDTFNTPGGGFVAQQGEWLLYAIDRSVIKAKVDNLTDWQQVSRSRVIEIYVSGDWIYYIQGLNERTLNKIRTDGTGEQRIGDVQYVSSLTVVDDWIYYHIHNGGLHKIRTDGTGDQKLDVDSNVYYPIVSDGWIYYLDGFTPYKIRTDGTGKQKISDIMFSDQFEVAGDWIYYRRYDRSNRDVDEDKLWKMRTDGTGNQIIVDERITSLRLSGEWIYYVGYYTVEHPISGLTWRRGDLYRIRTDGTGRQKLADRDVHSLEIIGDWIYYSLDSASGFLGHFRMRHDGTDRQEIKFP
jgi:hypothetical protein